MADSADDDVSLLSLLSILVFNWSITWRDSNNICKVNEYCLHEAGWREVYLSPDELRQLRINLINISYFSNSVSVQKSMGSLESQLKMIRENDDLSDRKYFNNPTMPNTLISSGFTKTNPGFQTQSQISLYSEQSEYPKLQMLFGWEGFRRHSSRFVHERKIISAENFYERILSTYGYGSIDGGSVSFEAKVCSDMSKFQGLPTDEAFNIHILSKNFVRYVA